MKRARIIWIALCVTYTVAGLFFSAWASCMGHYAGLFVTWFLFTFFTVIIGEQAADLE